MGPCVAMGAVAAYAPGLAGKESVKESVQGAGQAALRGRLAANPAEDGLGGPGVSCRTPHREACACPGRPTRILNAGFFG